jgi:hypothetical protein
MTRLFLAAGVAALAISAPAAARPGGHGGGGGAAFMGAGGQQAQPDQRKGGRAAVQRAQPQRVERSAPRIERSQRFAAPRVERFAAPRMERRAAAVERRPQRTVRASAVERRPQRAVRTDVAQRRVEPARPNQRVETRVANRQQVRGNERTQTRVANRQQVRANERVQTRVAGRQQVQPNRVAERQALRGGRVENRLALRNEVRADRIENRVALRPLSNRLTVVRERVIPVGQSVRFVGQPVRVVNNVVPLMALPASVSYLYPDTPDYYYRYGGGYLYEVDRNTSLIAALFPLLAGGFMPGQYLPNSYMNSYVPSYYGFNSFYPSAYSGFDNGYGYNNLCNRYANGVIYRVDCYTGMIVDVVPLYAGGYGVGQLLPSAYSYYNVPMQYRSLYYDTPDNGYWYAPGAIYQYDRGTSLISSVAALLSPGFGVGQPLPTGYGMYNVPLAYRSTYYDTPNAWYRYNNGYIYQVDPSNLLVTAIVASILT